MHPRSWRLTLRVLAVLSWIVSILWLIIDPGYEALLAFLGGVAAFLGAFAVSDAPTLHGAAMTESEQEIAHLQELQAKHRKNIRRLEEQLASYGMEQPLPLLNNLEFEREQLRQVEERLGKLAAQSKIARPPRHEPPPQLPEPLPPMRESPLAELWASMMLGEQRRGCYAEFGRILRFAILFSVLAVIGSILLRLSGIVHLTRPTPTIIVMPPMYTPTPTDTLALTPAYTPCYTTPTLPAYTLTPTPTHTPTRCSTPAYVATPSRAPTSTRTPTPPLQTATPSATPTLKWVRLTNSTEDFSNAQGTNQWYYMASNGRNSGDFQEIPWDPKDDRWEWCYDPALGNAPCSEKYVGWHSDFGHPGMYADIAKVWVSPVSGKLKIVGSVRKEHGGGDGVVVEIYRWHSSGRDTLWTVAIGANDTSPKSFSMIMEAGKGDKLFFVLKIGGRPEWDKTFLDVTIYTLEPIPTPIPPPITVIIDDIKEDSIPHWQPSTDGKSTIDVSSVTGRTGNAIEISYDLKAWGWVLISKQLDPGTLSGTEKTRFYYKGSSEGAPNTIELRLVYNDVRGTTFGVLWNRATVADNWTSVEVPYSVFNCWWPEENCLHYGGELNVDRVMRIDFAISNRPDVGDEPGSGWVMIDDVQAIK